jgi:amino acid permease
MILVFDWTPLVEQGPQSPRKSNFLLSFKFQIPVRIELRFGVRCRPFVIAINNAGIATLPSIVNAALLSSAWSAASSDLYCSSRALYALAISKNAPQFLTRVNSYGLPYYCVAISIACVS